MTDDGTRLVTHASGVGLYERRGQLLVVDRGVGWIYTANFVLGLLTFIFGMNAIVMTVMQRWVAGAVLAVLTALGGLALYWALSRLRARWSAPITADNIRLIVDDERGEVLDGRGRSLAPISDVRLQRQMQLASSSPALRAVWPGGGLVLARGNPFGGGLGDLQERLSRRMGHPNR